MKRRTFLHLAVLTAVLLLPLSGADTVLIQTGSAWKYLDDGTDQGTAWQTASFIDSAWKSGNAELGYGDGGEATVVGYGPDLNNKYVTTYFRRAFNVTDPAQFTKLTLRVLRDDGAVVYLNGVEAFRANMPAGAIGYRTLAPVAIGSADETTFVTAALNPALLLAGANLIAVEIHQANVTSTDISFDLELVGGTGTASVTRGPYLQVGTPSSMVIRWRTDAPTDSRVMYGAAPGSLTSWRDAAAATTEHQIKLDFLLPDTKYYYSVGTTTQTLGGGDANHYFYTSPPIGTVRPFRIWAISDAQFGGAVAQAVRNAYQTFTGATRTDVWLTAGDNAYPNGTDSELQSAMFNVFPAILRNTVVWPALGNHDMAGSANPPATQPYFMSFSMPTNGEAGGVASGTQRYYSYDYGNIHFVCLDSMTSDRSPTGAMLTWLKQDLAATRQRWIIAYWHHSPYSKGTHDSDTSLEMTQMRQAALPILEAANVDLVLSGHSHTYERSFLIDGHYGLSTTFASSMKKDGGSGRIGDTGAYLKSGVNVHEGTVYTVAGTASLPGALMATTYPAMYLSYGSRAGSLVLDVNGDQLDVKFLRDTGVIDDYYTIRKGVVWVPPYAPSGLTATPGSAGQINLSWSDNSANETGFEIERGADGVNFSLLKAVAANVTAYGDTGLTGGTKYYYRVLALNAGGKSPYSNVASATAAGAPTTVTLIPAGSIWKYLDSGTNQGTAWRAVSFNDSAWKSGPAQLGYGDGDETTIVSYGRDPKKKNITTYFRRAFNVTDPAKFTSLTLGLLRDDGAVVYLNGTEVLRSNMPAGTIAFKTMASTAIDGAGETAFQPPAPANPALLAGTNVIAVEIHQVNGSSTDISFDLELKGQRNP
jgi:hypothetical protein